MSTASIRFAAEKIRRTYAKLQKNEIDRPSATEIFKAAVKDMEPFLKKYDAPGVYWPAPIKELIQMIHDSGIVIPFIENMLRKQETPGHEKKKRSKAETLDMINEIERKMKDLKNGK